MFWSLDRIGYNGEKKKKYTWCYGYNVTSCSLLISGVLSV